MTSTSHSERSIECRKSGIVDAAAILRVLHALGCHACGKPPLKTPKAILMQPRMNRRFLISDAIALVAATGLGLAGSRYWLSLSDARWSNLRSTADASALRRLWIAAISSLPASSIFLLCWTVAVILLRLRGPRPRRQHLWCQPGFLACVAVAFVFVGKSVVLGLLYAISILLAPRHHIPNFTVQGFVREFTLVLFTARYAPQMNVGSAVLLAWFVTYAAGRCRPETSWVDRLGRVVGVVWVFLSLLAVSTMIG